MEKAKRFCVDGLGAVNDKHGGLNQGSKDWPWVVATWEYRQANVHVEKASTMLTKLGQKG